ncbi:MAG: hypothetical protein KKD63_11425 [Proteobacteria bacterium]|nr:hypothetical protein [Desulfobulbaceae bacterium]MBU4153483.1 hypothetical protein [Pseudomonadota bacterium]
MDTTQFQAGLDRLAQPVLPLVRLVQLLFLMGPFATVTEVVAELNEPIETVVRYEDPAEALLPYLDLIEEFQRLKDTAPAPYSILDSEGNPLPLIEAVDWWVAQQVVTRELESINSLLCSPCGCSLCCVGPTPDLKQVFFSIPLKVEEVDLFVLPRIDTFDSRSLTVESEPPLIIGKGQPFYELGPGLYCWQSGWSMILPTGAACPHLTPSQACAIYPQRPEVCRRPQIFAYLIDRPFISVDFGPGQTFRQSGTILAIWDCPYVKQFQAEIAAYAELCDLEPVFKMNKA